MKTLLIQHATFINEGKRYKGSLLIEGDSIRQIIPDGEILPEATEILEAEGLLLLPGVIDDHVHFRDPGLTHKANIQSESCAAAAGGVTSYMDMPNCIPQTTTIEALNDKFAHAAETSRVNYSFYFGATNENTELLSQLDPGKVCGVKLFMGSSTGNMLVDKREALQRVFKGTNLLIAAHCEDSARIAANSARIQAKYGEDPAIKFHPLIRDAEACYASTALAVELADTACARLHILHLTTARELDLFSTQPLREKRLTAEACVAHLLFYDKDYATLGTRIKCNPAIKSENDRNALREAVKKGKIDVIGTDHAPHLLKEKEGGALKAVSGMPMIQFSLITMLDLCKQGIFTYEEIIEKMCHAPAILYKIRQRGFLREGYKADLVLVDPTVSWQLAPEQILSKCGWSPLEGHRFTHQVKRTWVNGHTVFHDGILDNSFRGSELRFE